MKHNPSIVAIHGMIHRQALASKPLLDPLRVHLQTVINIVNFVKGSALNTRLFRNLCIRMLVHICWMPFMIQCYTTLKSGGYRWGT